MTEAEKLQREIRNMDDQAIARAEQLYRDYENNDPDATRWVLYGLRCAHQLSQPGPTTMAIARIHKDKNPELYGQSAHYKRKKEEHQRKMLRSSSNPSGDATIAKLQNIGGLARRSQKWVWTPDRVYCHLLGKYGQEYADLWVESYEKEKALADKNGWRIELHPEGSIITHKNNKEKK